MTAALLHLVRSLFGIALSLLICAALGYCTSAHAEGITVGVDLYSHHAPARSYQNNANLGVYLRAEDGLAGGVYRNTLRRNSLWLGQSVALGPVDVIVGAVSGYQRKCTDTVTVTPAPPPPVMVIREQVQAAGAGPHALPPTTVTTQECHGFSRGWATPMVAPSIALPRYAGLTPRLWLLVSPHRFIAHASVEF